MRKGVFALIAAICFAAWGAVSCTDGRTENELPSQGEDEMPMKIVLCAGDREFSAELADSETAREFFGRLPITIDMSAMAHEKYYYFSEPLPTAEERVSSVSAGDLMLWGDSCFVIFYESFSTSYSYTRLGKIEKAQGLAAALGGGSVTVSIRAQETE